MKKQHNLFYMFISFFGYSADKTMIYSNQLVETTKSTKKAINEMISASEKQNAKNIELLYSLQSGLQEALIIIDNNKKPDLKFVKKWNRTMGLASRFFDGDPFLENLLYIDSEIIPGNLKLY